MICSGAHQLDFLTNEPLDGEILADRLSQGPIAPEEALRYAIGIGSALAKAHALRLVHGSLSPYSILLTASGPCILKRPGEDGRASAYRSPEQVRGMPVDWRSDIFAFGAVLYELACGRRAFEGSDTGREILEGIPPALPAKSPLIAAMEGVAAGCMAKNPAARRQRIQNAVIELKLAGRPYPRTSELARLKPHAPVLSPAPVPAPLPRRAFYTQPLYSTVSNGFQRHLWVVGALLALVAMTGVAAVLYLHTPPAPVYRFNVPAPEHSTYPGMPAISPDGRYLTLSAVGPEGKRMLWVRALDENHPHLIPGTEDAFAPFWSPDSQFIGFFANQSVRKVPLKDGTPAGKPVTICEAEAVGGGGTWNSSGAIVFAPGLAGALYWVSANGGKPQPVTQLDASQGELSHLWPEFLPDGKSFVFFVLKPGTEGGGVYAGKLDATGHRRLFRSQTNAVFSTRAGGSGTNGYLLYIRDRNLLGQAVDSSTLETTGDPITLDDNVGPVQSLSLAQISVSNNAILVYQSAGKATRQLIWMDRTGKALGTLGEAADWGPPRISPDGKRVAAGKLMNSGNANLWILGLGGREEQLTNDSAVSEISPVWSPDGSRLAFATAGGAGGALYVTAASADGKADMLFESPNRKHPDDWTSDGKYILFTELRPGTSMGVWALSMPNRRAVALIDTVRDESYPSLSPDGKWLAYQSDETGTPEVYVQPFENATPGTKRLMKISVAGGGLVRWRSDGGELFYMTQRGQLMAATIHSDGDAFTFEAPQMLFRTRPIPGTWNLYDAAPDGQKFIVNAPMEWPNAAPITVTTSWTRKLEQ